MGNNSTVEQDKGKELWSTKCSGKTKKGHPVRLISHGRKANFLKGKGVTNMVRRQG